MDDKLYAECLKNSSNYDGVNPFWDELATRGGYDNSEKLRSAFRREREKRGDHKIIDMNSHRVIIVDIETLPLRAYTWDVWKQNIAPSQLIDDWILLSWASKDLMRGEVRSDVLTPSEAKKRSDKRIVKSLWEEFDDASILIGHNVADFDIPKSNTRFLYHRLAPPSPYRIVDTLKILKYNFRFTFNRLDYINTVLGLTPKLTNDGFPLWAKCSIGDKKALKDMETYNRGDILSSEELYLAVRAWDNRHPSIGLFYDDAKERCKHCGEKTLVDLDKPYFTLIGEYQTKRCTNCGAINRTSKNKKSKEMRDALLR